MPISTEYAKSKIAENILNQHLDAIRDSPPPSEENKTQLLEDIYFHLEFLTESIRLKEPKIYSNYTVWASGLKMSKSIYHIELVSFFSYLVKTNDDLLGSQELINEYIEIAKTNLTELSCDTLTYIPPKNPYFEEANQYLDLLLSKKREEANNLINELVDKNIPIGDIYKYIFLTSQYQIGKMWQRGEINYADEQYCTAATLRIMSGLYDKINCSLRINRKLVATAISSEKHDFGIRMVCDFFEMAGWDTVFLGENANKDDYYKALEKHDADIIAISITLSKHIGLAKEMISELRSNKKFNSTKILIGGYALNLFPNLWHEIGADGYGSDAEEAIIIANKLLNIR